MTVFSKLVAVVTALSSAAATSSGDTMFKLSTHRSHSGPNNTTFVTYHPPTQYETFGPGTYFPKPGWMDLGLDPDFEFYPTPEGIAFEFLGDRYGRFKSTDPDALDPPTLPRYSIDRSESESESVTYVYFKQRFSVTKVANAVAQVVIKDKRVVAYGANFVSKPKYIAPETPRLTFSEAIAIAESKLDIKYYGKSVKLEYIITDPDTAILTYIIPLGREFDRDPFDAVVDAESGRIVDAIRTRSEVKYRILEFMEPDPTGRSMVAHAVDLSNENQVLLEKADFSGSATSAPSETGSARNVSIIYDCSDKGSKCVEHFGLGSHKRLEHSEDDVSRREGSMEELLGMSLESHLYDLVTRLAGGEHRWCLSTTESSGMGQGSINIGRITRSKISTETPRDFTISRQLWNDAVEVRSVPYSINMTINPLTYGAVPSMNDVHHIGAVWTMILVEVNWGLVSARGYKSPFSRTETEETDGSTIFRRLVTHGLRIQPCNPTFLTGRDAIIQADENLYGGENKCTLWKAFAKRGLGVNAADYNNDFSIPSEC